MTIKSTIECSYCNDEAFRTYCYKHLEEIKEEAYDAGFEAGKKSDEPSEDEK